METTWLTSGVIATFVEAADFSKKTSICLALSTTEPEIVTGYWLTMRERVDLERIQNSIVVQTF